jgi:carboxylate-amine ligase
MSFGIFHGSPHATLGVELELQIVDARSLALRDVAVEILTVLPEGLRCRVKSEFHACCLELNTGICQDVAEVGRDLDTTLRTLEELLAARGLRLAWGGTHPFSHWQDSTITPEPRYRALAAQFRETLSRQLTFGMHVHVGVREGDAAVRACARLRDHLPALLALSSNSPFWCGQATGLHSYRLEVLSALPVGGPPPEVDRWDSYHRLVVELIACGVIQSLKDLWWDARVNPTTGTVEVRICDVPADLDTVLALTALIQCLVHRLASEAGPVTRSNAVHEVITRNNRWRAARYGLAARLVDPSGGETQAAAEVVERLVRALDEVAVELGCEGVLRSVLRRTGAPTGAERLLAVYGKTGDLRTVTRRMVDDAARSECPETWPTCNAPWLRPAGLAPFPGFSGFVPRR